MLELESLGEIVVLVVEDETLIRVNIADCLMDAGFRVLEASNADEAMSLLRSRADIRIVFTDIDMVGSMNGLGLAAEVRKRWPPIAVVLTSGFRAVEGDALPAGCGFIPKPYSPETVVTTLRDLAR